MKLLLEAKQNGIWYDLYWCKFENGESIWLSFRLDLMSRTEKQLLIEAIESIDIGEICNLWDSNVWKIHRSR